MVEVHGVRPRGATDEPSTLASCIPNVCFPPTRRVRGLAVELYDEVRSLPIISPHGHTDPRWFADNLAFADPVSLLITPDHYLTRMLYSQGIALEDLGVVPTDGAPVAQSRPAWRTFATHYHLFRATPSGLWFDHVLAEVFGVRYRLDAETADEIYDQVADALGSARVPAPGAARTFRRRAPGHDRFAVGRSRRPRPARPGRTRTPGSSPPSGPIRSSIRVSRASRTTSTNWAS